jgi:hypothetical protein
MHCRKSSRKKLGPIIAAPGTALAKKKAKGNPLVSPVRDGRALLPVGGGAVADVLAAEAAVPA